MAAPPRPKSLPVRHLCLLLCTLLLPLFARADLADTIERVKPAVVIVGLFSATNSPQFALRGTGFVVGDGNQVATNAHVLPGENDVKTGNTNMIAPSLVVQVRGANGEWQMRQARLIAADKPHDLALLRIDGPPVARLALRDAPVREGQSIAFMGFPIGGALGFSPVTHRGMVSSITPIVLPSPTARQLDAKVIRRTKEGNFNIYQLDATAYPGNSGGPLFDPENGEVLGIINMVFVKGSKESVLSQPSGITYAIPIRYLEELLGTPRR